MTPTSFPLGSEDRLGDLKNEVKEKGRNVWEDSRIGSACNVRRSSSATFVAKREVPRLENRETWGTRLQFWHVTLY
jgi:hypothetical protein